MEADPKVVLEWLGAKNGELRALQLTALEQLCNEVLFSDNVDVFCECYPPKCFIPALCRIFLDDQAPADVLEANSRAVSYYVDMHLEWCRYITQSPEVIRALACHLESVDMRSLKSNEFGQQLIKLMKIICNYDPTALYTNGGLTAVLHFVRDNLLLLHTDVLQAGMELIQRLFSKADPADSNVKTWISALSALLNYREAGVADQTLRAFANLVARFAHSGTDPSPLAHPHIINCLLHRLRVAGGVETSAQLAEISASGTTDAGTSFDSGEIQGTRENVATSVESNPAVVQAVTNILITLCCSSSSLTHALLTSDGQFAATLAMVLQRSEDETVVLSVLRLVNILLVLLYRNSDFRSADNSQSLSETETKLSSSLTPTNTTLQSDSYTPIRQKSPIESASPSTAPASTESESSNQPSETTTKPSVVTSLTDPSTLPPNEDAPSTPTPQTSSDRDLLHRSVIEAIKQQNFDFLKKQIDSGNIDVNYTDHLGQTLLNWAASFGTPAMVDFLCSRGANVHQGVRSPLDYAATFGRVEVCRTLLARGADPNQRDNQGRRPIDRAREQAMCPGCQQVIDLLEKESKRSNSTVTTEQPEPSSNDATSHGDQPVLKKSITEAQRIFVHQLFPMLVGLYGDSVSPSVKRQCLLLVRQMVVFILPEHLEEISVLDCQNLPFAFALAQLIYNVLTEETDEFILRALVLSQHLLVKAPRIYVRVFHRLGLFPMIKQLADIWTHLIPPAQELPIEQKPETGTASHSYELMDATHAITEETTEADSSDLDMIPNSPISAEKLRANQLYCWCDWNLIWVRDMLSMFNPSAFVIVLLHPTDGGLRALAVHGGNLQKLVPVMLSPGQPATPRPGLKSHMLRLHHHLIEASEHLDKKMLWPCSKKRHETNAESEADSSSHPQLPPRSSHGKFEANKANLRRVGLHLGLRRPPGPMHAPKSQNMHPTPKSILQRQASSPARTCIPPGRIPMGTSDKPTALGKPLDVVTIGPVVCSLRETSRGSRLCIQARSLQDTASRGTETNSSFNEALLFFEEQEQGFCRVRISSVFPEGSTTKVSEVSVFKSEQTPGDSSVEKKESASNSSQTARIPFGRRRYSTSLLTRLSKVDSELQSDGEKSSTESSEYDGEAPELFDFNALFGLNTDDIFSPSHIRAEDEHSSSGMFSKSEVLPEVSKELTRIHEILFPRELVYETYTSGYIDNWLSIDADCIATENKDRQERALKQLTDLRKRALNLSKDLLEILSNNDVADNSITVFSHDELRDLRSIATDICTAHQNDKSRDSSHTLNALSVAFKKLADLLLSGEQSITAYELTISGLVPALLLCLSAAHAGCWNCPTHPVGPDVTTMLLWYLRERRRVFLQHMFPRTNPTALTRLSRRVVHAFELSEHLPLRLFALSYCFSTPSLDPVSSEVSQSVVSATPQTQIAQPEITKNELTSLSETLHSNVASLPLGLIRAAQKTDSVDGSELKASNETQQFADCLDATEIRALFTFCPHLVCRSDEDYVLPGMHQINTRIYIKLEKLDEKPVKEASTTDQIELKNWSSHTIQVNPLVTAAQIEQFLIKMSTKQWYHKPRTELTYWNQIAHVLSSGQPGITFSPPVNGISTIDSVGGVIDWLATDGNTRPIEQWVNPALIGLVTVASSVSNLCLGDAASVLGPRSGTLIGGYPVRCSGVGGITRPTRTGPFIRGNCGKGKFGVHSGKLTASNEIKAWFAVDLGLQLIPTAYSMAYLREAESNTSSVAPRNWNLEASNDGIHWTVLRRHVNDSSIHSFSGSRAAWDLTEDCNEVSDDAKKTGYRFFKVQSTGVNANGSDELALGGLEFYGTVCATHKTLLTSSYLAQLINRESSPNQALLHPDSSAELDATSASSPQGRQHPTVDEESALITESGDNDQNTNPSAKHVDTVLETTTVPDCPSVPQPPPVMAQNVCDNSTARMNERNSEIEDNDVDDDEEQDTREIDEHSRNSASSERLFGGLGLLDLISQGDANLLQYLHELLSPDRSPEGIGRFLRQIGTQDSTDDESLSHFAWPKKLSSETSPAVRDVTDCSTLEASAATHQYEAAEDRSGASTAVPPSNWTKTAVSEPTTEPQQQLLNDVHRTDSDATNVDKSSSQTITNVLARANAEPMHHTALSFVSQESDSSRQTTNVSEPYELNPEDAEALEFADTVEAIIESNISSSDSPFPRGLPPAIPDRFIRLGNANVQSELSIKPRFETARGSKMQTTLSSWYLQKRERTATEKEAELDVHKIVSEPDCISGSHPSPNPDQRDPDQKTNATKIATTAMDPDAESGNVSTPTGENNERTYKDVLLTNLPSELQQTGSLTPVTSVSESSKPPSTEDPYKVSLFPTPKGNRQLRRRLRRPRPRGAVMSHHNGARSQNQSPESYQPFCWDEAVEYLRLPPGLIPVFDPNPGCTNAPATTPFVLCNPPSKDRRYDFQNKGPLSGDETRISLFLSAFNGNSCLAKVPMTNKDATLFKYIQELCQEVYENYETHREKYCSFDGDDDETGAVMGSIQADEPPRENLTLKLGYRLWHPSDTLDSGAACKQPSGLLSSDDLRLTPDVQYPIKYTKSGIKVTMLNEAENKLNDQTINLLSPGARQSAQPTSPEQLLNLLTLLYQLSGLANYSSMVSSEDIDTPGNLVPTTNPGTAQITSTPICKPATSSRTLNGTKKSFTTMNTIVQPEDFVSGRLTRKLLRQIRDPLAMSSGALPDWCFGLSRRLTALFSFDSRFELLKARAFGPARSVMWLQNQSPVKSSGAPVNPLSRSHSDGSSASSGTHRTRRSALTAAHTLILSSLIGQRDSGQVLSPSIASDVLLLRPSILSQLTTSSANENTNTSLDQPSQVDSSFMGALFHSLGLTLPPGFSLRSNCSRELNELWNCLLSRTARTQSALTGDNRATFHVGRLQREFVRLPRLPRELVGTNEQAHIRQIEDSSPDKFVSTFWDWAACLMEEHASRKAELEIQFIGEDGTGLGPTLEFYSLLAAELRRRDGLMWVVDDSSTTLDNQTDDSRPGLPTVASKATIGSSSQPQLDEYDQTASNEDSFDLTVEAHAYVNTAHGLFPAPWPQDRVPDRVLHRFFILGITVAKCLQDNRRIDLPFSPPLLKLLSCYGSISLLQQNDRVTKSDKFSSCVTEDAFSAIAQAESVLSSINPSSSAHVPLFYSSIDNSNDIFECDLGEFMLSPHYRRLHETAKTGINQSCSSHWLSNILDLNDFKLIYPERAQFFRQAVEFCRRKYHLGLECSSPHATDPNDLEALALEVFGCGIEDMCLTMEYLPTAKIFSDTRIQLCDIYDWESSSTIQRTASPKFDLMEDEDSAKVSGDFEAAAKAVEPEAEPVSVHNIEQYVLRTLSYCLDKGIRKQMDAFQAGFERVLPLDWLALFSGSELGQLIAGDSVAQWSREDLLAYTVPCFGFTQQSPTYQMFINVLCGFNAFERRAFLQFTTGCSSLPPGGLKNLHPRLRVVRKDAGTGALPSVNTCVHYLKLPEYQNEEELRTMLLRATREIGFYLN